MYMVIKIMLIQLSILLNIVIQHHKTIGRHSTINISHINPTHPNA